MTDSPAPPTLTPEQRRALGLLALGPWQHDRKDEMDAALWRLVELGLATAKDATLHSALFTITPAGQALHQGTLPPPASLVDLLSQTQAYCLAASLSTLLTRCPGSGTLTTNPSTVRARVTITTTVFLPVAEGDDTLAISGYGDERAWFVVEDALEAQILELVTESALAKTLDLDDTAVTVAGEIKLLNPPPIPSASGPTYYRHPKEEIL